MYVHITRGVACAGAIALLVSLSTNEGRGESDIEKAIRQFGADRVGGYIQPMADLFGADVNGGFFRSAEIPVSGFHLTFELIGMGSMVQDAQKVYTAAAPAGFSPQTFQTATIFGGQGTTVQDAANPSLSFRGSDGALDATLLPFVVPQLSIGSVGGTDLKLRAIPVPETGDLPRTLLFGVAVRHSINQYIPSLPFALAGAVTYTRFTVGDIIDFTGITVGAQVSRSFGVLTLYGGPAWEKSTMELTYDSTDPYSTQKAVDITLDGASAFRFTAGMGLSIGFFKIFGDVHLGSIVGFSGGIGFGS